MQPKGITLILISLVQSGVISGEEKRSTQTVTDSLSNLLSSLFFFYMCKTEAFLSPVLHHLSFFVLLSDNLHKTKPALQRVIFTMKTQRLTTTWLANSARSLRSATGWAMRDLWPWDVGKKETYGGLDASAGAALPLRCQLCCTNKCCNHRRINLPRPQTQSRKWSETRGRVNRDGALKVHYLVGLFHIGRLCLYWLLHGSWSSITF